MKLTLTTEEHTMITAKLEAGNLAVAEVHQVSERAVQVRIEAGDRWDAAGLRRLSALLKGVSDMLEAE